jgi:L-lactate dehydrogenase complex protein LldE
MSLSERSSPAGKPVSLFVTCMIDMIAPETGMSVVKILEHLGIPVDFPMGQTCCGQPGFNAGYRREARQVARQFLRAFQDAEAIVTPSGSCAAMIRHEYRQLFADDPALLPLAEHAASITWEFTEYLVDGLGISDLQLSLPTPRSFAIHDSCHGLRLLGLGEATRALLNHLSGATLVDLHEADVCCGFGGLFSIKMPDVSGAMLAKKINNINACPADAIVAGDVSCITQMNGGLSRQGSAKRVNHIANVLAAGLPGQNHNGS